MGFDAQDKEIVRLLTKLKDTDRKYPSDLFAARRQGYLRQMGEIGLGIGAGAGIKNLAKGGKVPVLSSETGTVAYFYRDKLADLFQTITKEVDGQEITPPPVHTELAIQGITPSPAVTATLPSSTLSASPTGTELTSTPPPGAVEDTTISTNSTPAPNENNGNHYGQTPRPERTKDPKANNDQPPKDNSKSTKT